MATTKLNELKKLAAEKAHYEADNSNYHLQQKELQSIANAVLYVANSMTDQEISEYVELINWAKSFKYED